MMTKKPTPSMKRSFKFFQLGGRINPYFSNNKTMKNRKKFFDIMKGDN